jgi:hypothetical protein
LTSTYIALDLEVVPMEGIDTEDMNKRLVDAELKIWKKVEDIAYSVGKHPDEVHADLMIQFSEFIEKKYPTKEYPNKKSAEEQIKKLRSRKAKETTQNELDD